jgi:hypothetical protein
LGGFGALVDLCEDFAWCAGGAAGAEIFTFGTA